MAGRIKSIEKKNRMPSSGIEPATFRLVAVPLYIADANASIDSSWDTCRYPSKDRSRDMKTEH
jgi:hypothetical protein